MSRTDLVADMLTLVRNANNAKKEKVDVPCSKINLEILRVLKDEGFIQNYRKIEDTRGSTVRIYLKFVNERPALTNIKKISKPGLRVYADKKRTSYMIGGMGITILTTSKGVMTQKQAKEAGVGGEILCYAW
ncbi:MAG: 30S ribosomal protein S8 [Candidatus Omnitrophota bacterium]